MVTGFYQANIVDRVERVVGRVFGESVLNFNNYRHSVHDMIRVSIGDGFTSDVVNIVFDVQCQGRNDSTALMRTERFVESIKAITTSVEGAEPIECFSRQYDGTVDRYVCAGTWAVPVSCFHSMSVTDMVAAAKLVG